MCKPVYDGSKLLCVCGVSELWLSSLTQGFILIGLMGRGGGDGVVGRLRICFIGQGLPLPRLLQTIGLLLNLQYDRLGHSQTCLSFSVCL